MRRPSLAVVLFVASIPALAQPTDPNALYVRVVDVGAGLCCVVKMPGGHYMVYDAGNGVTRPFKGVSDVIPDGEDIDLMILSHPDSDHLGAVKKICDEYKVRRVIRTGYERPDIATRVQADTAVRDEVVTDGCRDINLRDHDMPPGRPISSARPTSRSSAAITSRRPTGDSRPTTRSATPSASSRGSCTRANPSCSAATRSGAR